MAVCAGDRRAAMRRTAVHWTGGIYVIIASWLSGGGNCQVTPHHATAAPAARPRNLEGSGMIRALGLALLLIAAGPLAAEAPKGDVPELGGRSATPIGVRTLTFRFPGRPDVTRPDGKGGFATAVRVLPVTIWYPSTGGDQHVRYVYKTSPVPTVPAGRVPASVSVAGAAAADAPPAPGRFPLVVISHGFLNRAVMFSDLAEIIASKGYVVASIDHGDLDDLAVSRDFAFMKVVANRAADQRLVIDELTRRAAGTDAFWLHVDATRMALAGYSMGGYGALATAGATYDLASPVFRHAPPGTATLLASAPPPVTLKALIAFAPWGGGQPLRVFDGNGLAKVTVPSLFIDGDQDDVADFAGGVRYIFDGVRGDRYLLVYQNARHNIATNATPPELQGQFEYRERQDEPVWRKDRILAINAHMITAFLDWQLKGRADRRTYLDVPVEHAADGVWPVRPGVDVGAAIAQPGTEPHAYWPGFQRRWALGLELIHKAAQ